MTPAARLHQSAIAKARAAFVAKAAEQESLMERDERICRMRDQLAPRPMPTIPRLAMPVDVTDENQFPHIAEALAHLASLSPERRAQLDAEWAA